MLNEETVKVLNHLIQTSVDGQMGFAGAAKGATNPELKIMFQGCSVDCGAAVIELQALVHSLGGSSARSETVARAVSRGWARVQMTIGDTDIGMLKEVERAEDRVRAVYVKALRSGAKLPPQVRNVVQRQHDGAVRNHNLIRDLRNNYKAAREAAPNGPFAAFRFF
jgi:uncharacterized protein (TIGR02284 family)